MRVLIVEDEPGTLNEIEDSLRSYDETIEIEAFGNPLQALEANRSRPFDAALLDIQMPEMTGLELADCLSATTPEISLVFITAFNNYAAEAFELNAVDYILKPVRQERFYKALDKIRKEITEREQAPSRASGESPALIPGEPTVDASEETTIQVFGKLTVSSGNRVLKWKRQKSSEIFAYLLHQQCVPVHKEKLCEMIWPEYDPKKALTYLQTIMYQLRKNIAELGDNPIAIEYADHCYRLNLNGVRTDAGLFWDAYQEAFRNTSPSLEALIRAEQFYTGGYFEEEGWIWALGRQLTLAARYQSVLEAIIRLNMEIGNKEGVLYYLQKWAALDGYKNESEYLSWVRENIGADEAEKLQAYFLTEED